MLPLAAALLAVTAAGIVAYLRWASHQLYFIPESFSITPSFLHGHMHTLGEFSRAFLCLAFLLLPFVAAWLVTAHTLSRAAVTRIAVVTGIFAIALLVRASHYPLDDWTVPWIPPMLQTLGMASPDKVMGGVGLVPIGARVAISVLVVVSGLVMTEQIVHHLRNSKPTALFESASSHAALWLLGPFTFVYLFSLVPRAATGYLQDRYLLCIMLPVIVLLLLAHQRWIASPLPALSVVVLIVFALYTVAASHNIYSFLRAEVLATEELRSAGVPRTSIAEGFAPDGWAQLELVGHLNFPNMVGASEVYNPHVPAWNLPENCPTSLPWAYEPAIRPQYFVTLSPTACLAPTQFLPVTYTAWLPPFHRKVYVQQIQKNQPRTR